MAAQLRKSHVLESRLQKLEGVRRTAPRPARVRLQAARPGPGSPRLRALGRE